MSFNRVLWMYLNKKSIFIWQPAKVSSRRMRSSLRLPSQIGKLDFTTTRIPMLIELLHRSLLRLKKELQLKSQWSSLPLLIRIRIPTMEQLLKSQR